MTIQERALLVAIAEAVSILVNFDPCLENDPNKERIRRKIAAALRNLESDHG